MSRKARRAKGKRVHKNKYEDTGPGRKELERKKRRRGSEGLDFGGEESMSERFCIVARDSNGEVTVRRRCEGTYFVSLSYRFDGRVTNIMAEGLIDLGVYSSWEEVLSCYVWPGCSGEIREIRGLLDKLNDS